MKWKTKYLSPDPEPGSTRVKRVFAWLPTEISGTVVWLACFEILQGFVTFEYVVTLDGAPKKFKVSKWKDLSTRLIEK